MAGTITPYGRRQILIARFLPDTDTPPAGLWLTYTVQIPVDNADGSMLDEPAAGLVRAPIGALTSTNWDVSDFGEVYNLNVVTFADATAKLGYLTGWAVVDSAVIGAGNCWAVGAITEPFLVDNTDPVPPADVADIVFGLYDS